MDHDYSTGLSLGLALGDATATKQNNEMYVSPRSMNGTPLQLDLFPLAPHSDRGTLPWENTSPLIGSAGVGSERSAGETKDLIHPVSVSWRSHANNFPDAGAINVSLSNSDSVVSNATGYAQIKRKRGDGVDLEYGRYWLRVLSDVEEEGCSRKKLRLSREQCALLEESFQKNRAPDPKQKEALARQLNLRPRQVEVWFQNRRARTKMKQTHVDCEILKRDNEALAEENRKLHMELEKHKALKMSWPPLRPASTCPSCERISAAENSSHFTLANSPFLSSPFRR